MAELLEELSKEQTKEIKEQKSVLIQQLGEMARNTELSLKDRKQAASQQQALIKQNHTLGGDLKKNYQDLKDGLSSTIDGVINETFGPFGGMVSSLTTGFFKRGKENQENLTQTELQVEQGNALLESVGGQSETLSAQASDISLIQEDIAYMADNQETAEDRRERLRKKGEKDGGTATPTTKIGDDGGGGFFPALGLIASTLGGIALGLVGGAWIPPVDELRKITGIFGEKFPKFTKGIKDFFGIADDLPKVPDAPTKPPIGFLDNFKLNVRNFFSFADDLPKIPDPPKIPDIPGFMKTADDLVDARYARMTQDLQQTADGLKVADAAAEGADAAGKGGKVASKARQIMGVTLALWMDSVVTKIDDGVSGLKVAAETGGITGMAAKMATSGVTKVFSRAFAIAGNPVFDVAAMAKDAYDVAAPEMDKNVRTHSKAEDWGGLIGGVIGGALGTMVGMPWLGVGLGNMAGEFVGSLADNPEVVSALETTRTNLAEEATQLTTEVADLEAKIKKLDPGSEMAKLMQAQLDSSNARLEIVKKEKAALESQEVKTAEAALKKAGTEGDALAASIAKLEADIEAAEEKGDNARVAFLERQLTLTEKEFEDAEANYLVKEKELRDATRKASATMAQDATNFFDRIATEGGFFGSIFSAFGAGLSEEEGGKQYLEKQIQKLQNDIKAQETEIKGGDERNFWGKPRTIIIKGLQREIDRLEEKKSGLATGGFIVNRPTWLPQSGVVIGESKSGSGLNSGGFADGRPELVQMGGGQTQVYPLGGPQADNFMQPVAQSIAGHVMNRMAIDKAGMGMGASGTPVVVNQIDNSVRQSTVNQAPRVINAAGPELTGRYGDFLTRVG